MKKMFLLIGLFLALFSIAYTDTICINSSSNLDGEIWVGVQEVPNNTKEAFTNFPHFTVGDFWNWIAFRESYTRAYLSFPIDSIPIPLRKVTIIDTAILYVYQFSIHGNDTTGYYPKWTGIPGGDTLLCIIDHIMYGDTLDTLDWTAGDIGDPQTLNSRIGVISSDTLSGYKSLYVTDNVIADISNNRNKSQFRIRFPINTDWDSREDDIMFWSGDKDTLKPYLYIVYTPDGVTSREETERILHNSICQNIPNPMHNKTLINYQVEKSSFVTLNIYNSLGQLVKTLINDYQGSGKYAISWDGKDKNCSFLPSGIYFYKLNIGDYNNTKRIVLVR
jgi:hypothetical protein